MFDKTRNVISVLLGGKLKDTSWIKPQLKELFAGKYDWLGFNQLYKEKLDRFNGKLYKYYSFSKDDPNHSLDNFKNDIIFFLSRKYLMIHLIV